MAIVESARTDALLERDELLDELRAALAEAERGTGRLVFVGGEAGVGKTALIRRFSDEIGGVATVLWGACDPLLTPAPLGPFLDIAAAAPDTVADVVAAASGAHSVAAAILEL